MALKLAIPGFDATDSSALFDVVSLATQDTGRSLSGSRGSIKLDSGAGSGSPTAAITSITPGTSGRMQGVFYFDNLPGSNCYVLVPERSSSPFSGAVAVDTTGHLQIIAYSGSALGSASTPTLSTATEYRICFTWNITNTTTHSMRVFVNGVLWCTETNNGTLTNPSANAYAWGMTVSPGANKVWHVAHCWADDDSGNTDPGEKLVTAKLPASNNVNTFGTAIGANPANRWTNVNERPLSTTNGWQTSAASQTENYGIEANTAGDMDTSGYLQFGFNGWVWAACVTSAPTAAITLNGSDTAVTLTTSPARYFGPWTTSATYPATQGVIGLNKTAGANAAQLYECGVIIVFNGDQPLAPGIDSAEDFGAVTMAISATAPGIDSAEDFGALKIGIGITVTGIDSAEDFGAATVVFSVTAPGIDSAEDFGALAIGIGVTVTGIDSAEDFGALTMSISATAPGIDSTEDFGAATVTAGGIAAPGIESAEDFGTLKIGIGITVVGIETAEDFGAATVFNGAITIVGIDSAEDFGAATVSQPSTAPPPAYASWPLDDGDLFYIQGSWTQRAGSI